MHVEKVLPFCLAAVLLACSNEHEQAATPAGNLTLQSMAYPEGAPGETPRLDMKVFLDRAVFEPVTVSYRSEGLTATPGEDYIETAGEVTIAPGSLSQTIPLYLVGDAREEPPETLQVEISVNGGVTVLNQKAIATIANDDTPCDVAFEKPPNPWLVGDGAPLNYAHRGGVIDFPENTLYAYKEVAAAGADVLEMDVYQTADNQLVVIHDRDVDRTTDGSGRIVDLSLAQLKRLDAAYWFVAGEGTPHDADVNAYALRGIATGDQIPPAGYRAEDFRIPTLEEVLQAFPNHRLNIELKLDLDGMGDYEAQLAQLLRRYGRAEDLIVVSFDDDVVKRFKLQAPCVHTAVPTQQATELVIQSLGGTIPQVPEHVAFQVPRERSGIEVVSGEFVDEAHAVGLAVQVFTINDCQAMLELIELEVDAIMTDRPLLLESLLNTAPEARSCE